MSEGLNQVHLIGYLGADPELRMTQMGQAMLKLRLATTQVWFDKDQKKNERTEWHRVTLWGRRAEALAKALCKGSRVYVDGEIRTSTYEKEGKKHYSTEITANNILFCGGRMPGAAAQTDVAFASSTNGYGHGSNGGFVKPPLPDLAAPEPDIPF